VKADAAAQRRLLDVQAIDLALAQLAHRRKNLPEYAELGRLTIAVARLGDELATARVVVDDLDRDIARIEQDVEQVRARKDRNQGRLDSGSGPARELEALMHEVATLTRRQGELEDTELELMEKREQAQANVESVRRRLTETRDQVEETEKRRDQVLRDISKDEDFKAFGRRPMLASVPEDLVALYERIRESSGGIGAALLRSGRCGGCRLELSGQELAQVRAAAADEVLRHEECGRILIRTPESGI
jgi:predicted  nucleic acid-binding Zn-ribbon protein